MIILLNIALVAIILTLLRNLYITFNYGYHLIRESYFMFKENEDKRLEETIHCNYWLKLKLFWLLILGIEMFGVVGVIKFWG